MRNRVGLLAGLIALTFIAAETVRPTRVPAKKIAAHALLLRSQAVREGARDSLDTELLDDIPRIHPDAVGSVRISERADGSFALTGTAADAYDGSAGAAIFLETDSGTRVGSALTRYGVAPLPRVFTVIVEPSTFGPGTHRLRVALISADQRGFFLLPDSVSVNSR